MNLEKMIKNHKIQLEGEAMKPRVLLCQPVSSEQSPQKNPPLGIIFAGAGAEREGYKVKYWDQRWDSEEELLDLIAWSTIVGVSSFTGLQLRYARRILELAKDQHKITVLGGIHANLVPQQCLEEKFIDFVAVGEGEVTLPELLRHLEDSRYAPKGIYGLNISFVAVQKLDSKDFVSPITQESLRLFRLANETNDVMLPASRGCPYRCGFCVNSKEKVKKYRVVDLAIWESWLDTLLESINIRWLQIGDDFLGNQERILKIGRILKDRGIKWHPSFRADNFNKEGELFANNLKDLGVTDLAIGIETGSERLMKLICKEETISEIVHAAKCLADVSIRPRYYFIIGFPTETHDERNETFDFADLLYKIHQGNCNIVFYNFTPFPGIALYDLSVSNGMKVPQNMRDWEEHTVCNSGTKEMQNIYHIAGFHFHQQPGSKTDMNFPGARRLIIKPFEKLCDLRWHFRYFMHFDFEKFCIEKILKYLRRK